MTTTMTTTMTVPRGSFGRGLGAVRRRVVVVERRVDNGARNRATITTTTTTMRMVKTAASTREERSGFELESVVTPLVESTRTLNEGIAKFYDESSGLWENVWGASGGDGTHMHHGYYGEGNRGENGTSIDHARAQVDMIDESLRWAGVTTCDKVLDVGCGIGGSSRHMARKFGCRGEGVTLSPVQAGRANALAEEEGLGDKVKYQVADALAMPFEDGSFDFVWSMESGEHMPDKTKFVNELARVCAPGGRILIVTWCHRVLDEGKELEPAEKVLLDRICDAYYLPAWCSIADYERLAREAGMVDIKTEDWSDEVKPFWKGVIATALTWQGVLGLIKAGPATLRGALVMPLMQTGLATGTIKFNLITMRKP